MKRLLWTTVALLVIVICPNAKGQGGILHVQASPQTGNVCGAGLPSTTHCVILQIVNPAPTATNDAATANNILRGTSPGNESSTPIATVQIPAGATFPYTLTYIDLNGAANQHFYYTSVATNSGGSSAPSNETNAVWPTNPPAAPTVTASSH